MRIGLLRVDAHGILEPLYGFGILTALLIDQPKLVLRLAVMRVDGRHLQHPPKMLTAAQAAAQLADLAAEIVVGVEQEKRRSQPSEHKSERPPEVSHRNQRNHDRHTTATALLFPVPNTVRTAKNIRTRKYKYARPTATPKMPTGSIHAANTSKRFAAVHAIAEQVNNEE